ncbi:ABC transporter substrate-binding protein [Cerasicoccus frondis]|uniref:ABC transporter substrate-binding protein n=1 Tax=Cerasicoccus frondis TaxID=490090 RepID=UPI0028528809|nr:ABC transporter substrate-binding protein [Cerasicoccus frondis]
MLSPKFLIISLLSVCLVGYLLFAGNQREVERADGRIEIEYWEKWTGFERDAMAKLVNEYNASQDEVFVKFLSVSNIDRKLMLATAGGNPPDLAGLWTANLPVFASNGALMPLDNMLAGSSLNADDYLPSIWQQVVVYDRVWGLPTTPGTIALHWNKRLFREVGLDPERPPRTMAELEAYNDQLTRYSDAGRIQVMGHMPIEPGWWSANWSIWFGGDIWNGEDEVTADSEANMAALEWIESYPERYGSESLMAFRQLSGVFASPENPFFRERIAMVLQGPWMFNFINNFAPDDFEWGVAPFPTWREEDYGASLVESDCLVIPQGAAHPAEAFAFMQWLQKPEQLEALSLAQLKFSPLREVSDEFYERHPNPHIHTYRELAENEHARMRPQMVTFNEFSNDMVNAIDEIMRDEKTAMQAAEEVQRRQQDLFARKHESWLKVREARLKEWDAR